jgi:type I restriction enzyme S subunit
MKSPWPTKKLGEICEENIKSPFKVEDATNSREYPFFTSGENVLAHDEYLVDGENIFLATGGYANVKYYNGKASYSTDTWSLKVKNALTKFVFYQILARLKYIDEVLFRGSGLRHLQKKEFLNLEIPLPPLPIQQKIVKILDTIQSAVEIQEKIIEKTKELKKSLMNLLFHYGLAGLRVKELMSSRVGELTSSEIEKLGLRLKKTEVGEIPEDWEVVRLGDVVKIKTGKSNVEDATDEGKYLFFDRSGEVKKSNKYLFDKEAVIVPGEGKEFLPKYYCGKFDLHQRAYAIFDFSKQLNGKYLFYTIHYFNKILDKLSVGTTVKSLRLPMFQNLKIPLPPLPEQQEIAEILQTIDQKIEIEKKKKELYEELFKTMLNKIMSQQIDINLLDH